MTDHGWIDQKKVLEVRTSNDTVQSIPGDSILDLVIQHDPSKADNCDDSWRVCIFLKNEREFTTHWMDRASCDSIVNSMRRKDRVVVGLRRPSRSTCSIA